MSSIRKRPARAVADLAEGVILATVEIAATPERVFRAIASEEVVAWWGDEGVYRTTEWRGDVRVGGRFRASGVSADGKPFALHGEYLEVDPPRRLVHTWQPDWDDGAVTRVSYGLEAIEGGTRLTLRHTGFSSRQSCARHGDGWTRVLGWLSAHLEPTASAHAAWFLMRLMPPRPSFLADMSADERRVMQEHVGYWARLLEAGTAVAFGPVADPKGAWGLGVVEVASADLVQSIGSDDPAIRSGLGFSYEVLPMPQLMARPHSP